MRIGKLLAVGLLVSGATLQASDYLTEGVDPGRTGWVQDETTLTASNVGGMTLAWKVSLDSTPREMHNLFAPLVVQHVRTAQGEREIAVVAGVSDDLFGIDVASGRQIWRTHFDSTFTPGGRGGGTLCPGGQTAVPVIGPGATAGSYTIYAVSWDGRLRQVNVADGVERPAEKFMPPNGKPYALNLVNGVIYTASAQGCGGVPNGFWAFDLATRRATTFNPAGGGLWGRRGTSVSPEGVAYLGTGDGFFGPSSKNLGNAIVGAKMDANGQLQLADYFAPPNANFLWRRDLDINVTPVLFDEGGRKFLVGSSKECRLWLLDRDALGGDDHRTALFTTPLLCNDEQAFDAHGVWGALATWKDAQGARWLAVPFWGPVSREFHAPVEHSRPTQGGVAAYRLEQRGGGWQLVPAWLSRNMNLAEETIVANGVVYAYGGGEDATQTVPDSSFNAPGGPRYGGGLDSSSPRRIPNSTHATVYALDAATGRELWSSGNQITSWNHFSGITVANGRVYLATFDGTLYCFGLPAVR
jgi:outer membrane protein assembly factor BamB